MVLVCVKQFLVREEVEAEAPDDPHCRLGLTDSLWGVEGTSQVTDTGAVPSPGLR